MGREIERKFLLKDSSWRGLAQGIPYKQGYLALGPKVSVRVRIEGDQARLNIKEATLSIERAEFEYPIPLQDAEELLNGHCIGGLVEKTRHKIPVGDFLWEVDEFHGENEGLVIAEVELPGHDAALELPQWVGREVSGEAKYLNANLCEKPYKIWAKQD